MTDSTGESSVENKCNEKNDFKIIKRKGKFITLSAFFFFVWAAAHD